MLNSVFRKSRPNDKMWENIVERRKTTDDNRAHANCMLDT